MSRPKDKWYVYVCDCMRKYPKELAKSDTLQARIAEHGIQMAIRETMQHEDAEDRLKFIRMVYFEKTHSFHTAAMECHVSERTAQRWKQDFVYTAGRYMAFR